MATFTQIGSAVVVGRGGAASIDFSTIPSTYTDLVVFLSARSAAGAGTVDNFSIKFNSSTTGYSDKFLTGDGSTASSSGSASRSEGLGGDICGGGATASTFSNSFIYIPNYAGSTNKSWSSDSVTENNATAAQSRLIAGLWSDTSAITSISLRYFGGGVNLAQNTTAYLYGVKNA